MMRVWRLSDVSLSFAYIGPESRKERPRNTKIGTPLSRSKGQRSTCRAGHIVSASRTACSIADKPRDAFVQMQCRGWHETRFAPYVLPCRIWSFCVKGYRHKYGRTFKFPELWNPAPFWWGVDDHLKTSPLPICVTTLNLVVLRQIVCA